MDEYAIAEAGPEGLDEIRGLWEQLNAHHATVSSHFPGRFERLTFAERKAVLMEKARRGALRIFLARTPADPAGYCAASITDGAQGEIESIFVDPAFRGKRLGETLMRAALRWLDASGAREKSVCVVYGNEQAHAFYRRFGFLPSRTILHQTRPEKTG